jgi:hypothetical protein
LRAALSAALALALACGCGSTSAPRRSVTKTPRERTASLGTTTPPPAPVVRKPPQPAPGSLPQTSQLPSAATAWFREEMAVLWRSIQTDRPMTAISSFFPEAAYAQVKAIADPGADFRARLLRDFALDVHAAHALLGAGAGNARLVTVDVPGGFAHWVPPGACYNRVGYYEVPNSRILYTEGAQARSFGIASMISWRGAWYVVHLGTVLRATAAGVVDDPSTGGGTSVPSSTC